MPAIRCSSLVALGLLHAAHAFHGPTGARVSARRPSVHVIGAKVSMSLDVISLVIAEEEAAEGALAIAEEAVEGALAIAEEAVEGAVAVAEEAAEAPDVAALAAKLSDAAVEAADAAVEALDGDLLAVAAAAAVGLPLLALAFQALSKLIETASESVVPFLRVALAAFVVFFGIGASATVTDFIGFGDPVQLFLVAIGLAAAAFAYVQVTSAVRATVSGVSERVTAAIPEPLRKVSLSPPKVDLSPPAVPFENPLSSNEQDSEVPQAIEKEAAPAAKPKGLSFGSKFENKIQELKERDAARRGSEDEQ